MPFLKEFLASEVRPALGCTEPGAVALAVSRACEELFDRQRIDSLTVTVSGGIYKGGLCVGIPGGNGGKGNVLAAALAAVAGHSSYGLEALKGVDERTLERAWEMVRSKRIHILCDPSKKGVYVRAVVVSGDEEASCLIEGTHSHIVSATKNGAIVYEASPSTQGRVPSEPTFSFPDRFGDLMLLADEMDEEDEAFLLQGARMNLEMAQKGLSDASLGVGLGRALKRFIKDGKIAGDLGTRIRIHCYAASEARMAGLQQPVMSSAGSGNHGIAAIIPIALAAEGLGKDPHSTALALATSHLATSFVKQRLGRLSPVCGCAVAAGSGAAAGLVRLQGGDLSKMEQAMTFVLANVAGMLCDGAKESCALKVGSAGHEAWLASLFAMEGLRLEPPQGVVGSSIEETVDHVARVNLEGMSTVDGVMIDILSHAVWGC